MKTAVIYARYSSDSQSEQSIEGQLRVCEEYAKTNDILILDTYVDRAMTGRNDHRPEFQRMIKDSAKKEWNYVIVYKLDRFSRNKYEMAVHKRTLKGNRVKLLSAMEYIPDSPEAIIIESMLEGYAEYYSAELSQKVKRGNQESRLKGNVTSGKIPYGYIHKDKKAVIVEERAEVVRYIYEQYAKGVMVSEIIDTLTAKGILYKNKPFVRNTVYKILKNEKYSGIWHYGDQVFDNIFPQIIDKDLFEIVRAKVEQNKYGRTSVKTVYLLAKKVFCGYCGKPIYSETGTARNGQTMHYYKCSGRKRGGNCAKSIIRKDVLEELVVGQLIKALCNSTIKEQIIQELLKRQDNALKGNKMLDILIKEEKQAQNALDNIVSAIECGVFNKTTQKRMQELELKIEDLQRQIIIEKSKSQVKIFEKQIREHYKKALNLDMKMLVELFIKKVVLFDDKVQIHLTTPLRESPDDENRGFLLYTAIIENKAVLTEKIVVELYV